MKKFIAIFLFILIFSFNGILKAENIVGFGLHLGAQHNVGNYASNDSSIVVDPQNNYFIGISGKTNVLCLFARFGADITYPINKGKVLENPANNIQSYNIQYISAPLFLGFNYKVLDIGNFYMGPGGAYILGRGKINYNEPSLSKEINTSAWGIGFITGVEFDLSKSIRFYFEWEYLDGRALSVQQSQTDNNWKDLYIDYTGHRVMIGLIYYVI
jgi:opacity protein-like surface antigen